MTEEAKDKEPLLAPIPGAPFIPLGYDHGDYYYLASGSGQIICLTGERHKGMALLMLAPLSFWEHNFRARRGVDYIKAADYLIRLQEIQGPFNIGRLRGCGPWWHENRVVLHLGNRIVYGVENGELHEVKPHEMPGEYIYERAPAVHFKLANPLPDNEAKKLPVLLSHLAWQRPISAKYVAGWIVCALIGGALTWRPHLWITGKSGSGKTWVMTNIIRVLLGKMTKFFLSNTTEAGLRQSLKRDSLPVVFDEAEGEEKRARERLQLILALVRQSSSDTQGVIAKGTPGGNADTFDVRSCFAFSSVNASLMQASDQSRVTVCELTKNYKMSLDELEDELEILLTPEYIERLYTRCIRLVPVIRNNARLLAAAVRVHLGDQRAGDQIGTLMAGNFSLESSKMLTREEAQRWVNAQDWAEAKQDKDDLEALSDEKMLYHHLLQQIFMNGQKMYTIGELVDLAMREESEIDPNEEPSPAAIDRMLWSCGFRPRQDNNGKWFLAISNTHSWIRQRLYDTRWENIRWQKVLLRLPRARRSEKSLYFGGIGTLADAVEIPVQRMKEEIEQEKEKWRVKGVDTREIPN